MMKKFLVLIMSAIMCLGVLAGCNLMGQKVGDDDLIIWGNSTYWGGANEEIVQQMLNKYKEEKGVEVFFVPQADLDTKLKSIASGADSPDIVIWDRWETLRYINENRFVQIDKYMEKSGVAKEDFLQEAMREMAKDGKQYGIPLDVDVWGFWVNKTLLAEKGITKLPSTWDELRTAAISMTEYSDSAKKTMTRAGMNLKMSGSFYSWMLTAGGDVLSEDGKTFTVNNDYGKAVLGFLWQLMHEDKVFQESFATGDGANDPFLTQKVAIQVNSLLNGTAFYNKYSDKSFEYEFIPFPKGPSANFPIEGEEANSNNGGMMGGFGLAIPTTSTKQDGAWDLINWWLCNTDNVVEWSELSGLLPAKLEVTNMDKMKEIPNVRNVLDTLPTLKIRPTVDGYTAIETSIIMSKIDGLLFENAYTAPDKNDKIKSCLADMERSGNEILEYYRELK